MEDKPPGYGFRPYDEELVGYYLRNKIVGNTKLVEESISEVNICSFDPWNLRFQSKVKSRDPVWYFFSRRENKYANGNRQSRRTLSGFWKLTGESVDVKDHWGTYCGVRGKIGHKRVLVFLTGKSSDKSKSDWVMHELHYTLLPEHQRTYVICRLEYKGDDINILSANATDPTLTFVPNMTNSAGSVVDQSRQANSGSHNTFSEYDSANQGHQFSRNFNMQQSFQGNSGSFSHLSEFDLANQGHWFSGDLNLQQQVPYSAPYEDDSEMWNRLVQQNCDFLVDERSYMQENRSDFRPKIPVTVVLADDSSDTDTDSTICRDTWSSTDSVGSSNGPYHTPTDDIPLLSTIEPLHNNEAQEQPKQLKLQSQGKEKVIDTQKSKCEWKVAQDSVKKVPSTTSVKESWIVLEEMSQRNSQWSYLKNMIIGFLLFISIIGWIILVC